LRGSQSGPNTGLRRHTPPGSYVKQVYSSFDRPGLGRLVEQVVELAGLDRRDEGIDHHRHLILEWDENAGVAVFEKRAFAYPAAGDRVARGGSSMPS
jgi:hypothetical protein